VLGTSPLWRSTVAFTYLKVKSAKCICLLPVVLVLSLWSWSWSCYFGLGLKNLVLFTSLIANDDGKKIGLAGYLFFICTRRDYVFTLFAC